MFVDTFHILGSFTCAYEDGICGCTGNVIYGKGSTWTAPMEVHNDFWCSNDVFGDPIPGTTKECLCFPSYKCADEGMVCKCKGTVKFGRWS